MNNWVCTTTVTRTTGGRPTKFEIMRRQRRHMERRRALEEFEELKEEVRAFGYADTGQVVAALCANDAKAKPVRRWWWPVLRVAAALSAVQLTKA